MTETYDRKRISKEFAALRVGVTPSAAELIGDDDDPATLINAIGESLDDDARAVEVEHVEAALDGRNSSNEDLGPEEGDPLTGSDSNGGQTNTEAPTNLNTTTTDETQESLGLTDESEASSGPDQESDTASETPTPSVGERPDDVEDAPVEAESDTAVSESALAEDADTDDTSGDASRIVADGSTGVRYIEGGDLISGETAEARWPDAWGRTLVPEPLPDSPTRDTSNRGVTISGDITGNSRTTGEYEDFQRLFRDRYKRLQKVLKNRMPPTTTISSINERMARRQKPTGLIGIVNEVRKTKNGHDLIEIEDTTGVFPVLFSKNHTPEPIQEQIERIIPDEVVGVLGSLADDAGILFGDELYFPDLPPMRVPNTADRPVKAVLLSDLHFGAVDFAADEWHNFVEWMHSEEAEQVEYVLIAGDLVEGIGVYPGQEKELDVVDIYDQYVLCAEALKQLPSDVDIYTIMGNHDTVRLAEPQPVIKEAFKEPFADNVHFAGNPATFDVEGVKFLLYHGMSLNPFTDRTPGLDIHEPTDAMQLMLEKRHLAPMYGMNVRLAPENEDYLIIEDIPDVLHTGHVHTFGVDTYKNVLMANTGCWQYQTDFQRKLNVEPEVGLAPVIDLSTLDVEVVQF